MRDPGSEWILVTVLESGFKKPVRPQAIMSYGTMQSGVTFIEYVGKAIGVRESEAEIAELLGSPYVGGVRRG